MSAEILRRAAALMRDRAEAANEGRWWGIEPITRALSETFFPPNSEVDAEHIAAWKPAVALAVADWLAGVAEAPGQFDSHGLPTNEGAGHAVNVARAYLGEDL